MHCGCVLLLSERVRAFEYVPSGYCRLSLSSGLSADADPHQPTWTIVYLISRQLARVSGPVHASSSRCTEGTSCPFLPCACTSLPHGRCTGTHGWRRSTSGWSTHTCSVARCVCVWVGAWYAGAGPLTVCWLPIRQHILGTRPRADRSERACMAVRGCG